MTCGEVREYLFAFLDSELDAPLSIELQRHLEHCPDCAREAEIERGVGKQLARTIDAASAAAPVFDDSLGGMFTHDQHMARWVGPSHGHRTIFGRRMLATAAAVLLVVGAGLWFGLGDGGAGRDAPRFVDLAVGDFTHFLEKGSPLQIASSDDREVAEWLTRQTGIALVLPIPADARCKLIGGRKCKIEGRPAAFAVYEMGGVPASLLVVAAQGTELEGMERVLHRGRIHWVDRCRGYTVVACLGDGLVYAAVSTLGQDELHCLMAEGPDESD